MSEREIVKEYSNGELTVVWKPKKCIHAAVCVNTLPKVYDPNAKPWITPENASTQELKDQIDQCPSGALSYYIEDIIEETEDPNETKVQVLENGPLLVSGNLLVTDKDGNTEKKDKATAFCRCGHSQNKPYCDGAHVKAEFRG
ncbi:MAG: (4Fe-4S)-binding protein [Bacteroidota bacterium]